ncbi:MAG TPA: hypothetical protein VHB48_02355, partial [Chitinophagaceae bacterium]|nr:hypothetical protein [Chitinophagaceae bacterium]
MPNNSKPYKKPFHSNRQHPAAKPESKIDEFSLFTGGKLPELAIAFNLAYDNTEKYIETLQNIKDPLKHIDELNDKVFAYLRHYMWKGNEDNKNTSGYELDKGDKTIIKMLLRKLVELRNFHSHVWHTNDMMQFDKPLVHFIEDKHDAACAKLLEEKKDADATLYYKQLDKFPLFIKGQYISQDGRFFLLSFFLNRGEMQGILQQRKGSKRNDTPEYRFKHKVFTYYCHREGASWDNTGINNDDLQQKDDAEQQRVLSGRNAFAIFNYLKDVPAAMREEAVPLILSSGKWVEDMYGLLLFINEKNILPGFVFEKKIEKASEKEAGNEKDLNEAAKALENKEREGYRHFMLPGNNAYEFEISYPVLRHIVTDIFLDDNDTSPDSNKSREHFKGVLKDCIDTRRYIYDKLKSQGNLPLCHETYRLEKKYSSIYINYSEHEGSMQEIYYTGDEWRNIPISATPKTEKLLIEWHNAFIKGTKEKPEKNEVIKRKKLLNKIRPLGTLFDKSIYEGELKNGRKKIIPGTDPDPLLFHLAYYYREQDTKKRRAYRFVEWGVQHLMHAGLVPGWYFETEQLEYGQKPDEPASPYKLKSATVWQKNIPQNFRLRITENQLNAGIERNGKIYRLRIGEKLLKYLLYWHFREKNKGNKSINGFLEAVTGELALIYNSKNKIDVGSLQLLEAFALPPLLFKTKIEEPDEKGKKATGYREQALAFFTKKQQWLEGLLRNMKKLTRSQKNEALLQAYRLFDFKETQGSKFLRKNEYGQMSV